MTVKFVSRALLVAGLAIAGTSIGFAQNTIGVTAKTRRVVPSKVHEQPVAASSVIMKSPSALNLTADQRAKVSVLNTEVSALQSERAKLWQEYRAITSAPNYSDEIAASQAAPRMRRIVEINNQLAVIVARQDRELSTVLGIATQPSDNTYDGSKSTALKNLFDSRSTA